VFLDRDGVLNRPVLRGGRAVAPRAVAEFVLLPGVTAAVSALRHAGFLAVVVTNQPEIARGGLDPAELARMHDRLQHAVPLDAIYVCPHDDADACACRKPKPGLLRRASQEWNISLEASFMVGDTERDLAAGKAVGCTTILVGAADPAVAGVSADFAVRDLPAAAELVLAQLGKRPAWSFPALRARQERIG